MYSEKNAKLTCRVVIFLILSVPILLLLASCASNNVPVTVVPTNFPVLPQPSETNTPFSTSTPRPTATITISPTIDVITALASEFNIPPVCLFTNSYIISNDHNWLGVDCKSSQELIIVNKSSGNNTIVRYQDLDKEVPNNFFVLPLSWSSDDQYFYFTTRCCDLDKTYSHNGSLYRFDTQTKKWDVVVRTIIESYYYFSENGERYVFINPYTLDEIEIGMVDTSINKSKRVNLKYYFVQLDYGETKHIWSNNHDQFAIVLEKITAIHIGGIDAVDDTTDVVLRIDFTKMVMELVEKFDENNLLGE